MKLIVHNDTNGAQSVVASAIVSAAQSIPDEDSPITVSFAGVVIGLDQRPGGVGRNPVTGEKVKFPPEFSFRSRRPDDAGQVVALSQFASPDSGIQERLKALEDEIVACLRENRSYSCVALGRFSVDPKRGVVLSPSRHLMEALNPGTLKYSLPEDLFAIPRDIPERDLWHEYTRGVRLLLQNCSQEGWKILREEVGETLFDLELLRYACSWARSSGIESLVGPGKSFVPQGAVGALRIVGLGSYADQLQALVAEAELGEPNGESCEQLNEVFYEEDEIRDAVTKYLRNDPCQIMV